MRCRAGRLMRVFACVLATSLALAPPASASGATPARVVSLNLCTDELLLQLASPGQIASVTHLSQNPRESSLWRKARRYPANDGSMLSAAGYRPDLVIGMGSTGRDSHRLARAIGARFVNLPFPTSLDALEAVIAELAQSLGRREQGRRLIAQLQSARATAPSRLLPAVFVNADNRSHSATDTGAEWMALAGLRQVKLPGDRIDREHLLVLPPLVLVKSDYRSDQYSRARAAGPLDRKGDRMIATEGRRWTCMGPSLLPEILRIRQGVAR